MNRMFCIFLFTFCEVANHFVAVREFWVVKGIVLVVKGLNIIILNAIYDPVTGSEQPIYVVLCIQYENKKGGKDQIDTIKYHTWLRIPNGKVTTTQFNTTKSQPAMTMLFEYSGSLAQHLTWMNISCYAGDMHGLPIMFLSDYIP